MITKPCPECGDQIDQAAMRHKCGWTAHINDRPTDHESWRCVHVDRGQRCANVGVVSPSVKHKTTPRFYCWQHVPQMEQFKDGVRSPAPAGFFDSVRKMLKPKKIDFEGELERKALQDEP